MNSKNVDFFGFKNGLLFFYKKRNEYKHFYFFFFFSMVLLQLYVKQNAGLNFILALRFKMKRFSHVLIPCFNN